MKNIILGVTGSISAYKAADIANLLTKRDFNVDVIMTKAATKFITPLTMQTLSKNTVLQDIFEEMNPQEVTHIAVAQKADLFLIAPATANILGKIASGIADDMLSATILATTAPVFIAPAMNCHMYSNKIVQNNILKLKELGYNIIEPEEGRLACGDIGKGKLSSVSTIIDAVEKELNK